MFFATLNRRPLAAQSSGNSCGIRAKCAHAYRHILLFVNPRSLAGLLALGLCAGASALSLGDLKVRSPIGSAFEAVLPYTANADEVLSPQCIRGHEDAASRNQHVPLLANVRFAITRSAGGGEIVIRTRALVHEPAVRIRLTVNCGPQTLLVREYVVLLDAPPVNIEPVPATVAVPLAAVPVPPMASTSVRRGEPRVVRRVATPPAGDAGAAGGALRSLPSLRLAPPGDRPARDSIRAAARKPAVGKPAPGYRLTLSQATAAEAGEPLNQPLKRSDELMSLVAPARTLGVGETDKLRAEARIRLSDNPFAEALQMQTRLLALEGGMGVLRKEVGEIENARRVAEDRARNLAAENRRLAAWLNGAALLVAFLLCAALAAILFWRYRLASEQRGRRERLWQAAPATAPATPAAAPETGGDADVSYQQWRSSPVAPAQESYQRTVVLDRSEDAGAAATRSAQDGDGAAPAVAPHVAPPAKSRPPIEMPAASVPAAPGSAPLRAPAAAPTAPPVPPNLVAVPAAQPPLKTAGADETEFYLPESALLADGDGSATSAQVSGTRRIPTGREKALSGADLPSAIPGASIEARALVLADQAMVVDFAIDDSRAIGMASGDDAGARARSARYFAEFERKLFPEIALGRVKLDDPRSIIGLARTYYQEDFDPGKAISFLEYALYRSSDPMRIHLALLEILRMERRVGEYAIVARTFRGQYPDSGTHWQLVAAYGRLLDPHEPTFEGDKVPELDLDTPSNWLGSTLDMTKYVLGQKVADSVRDLPAPAPAPALARGA